jgi:ABC-2 type transport system ATP-binding protein
MGNSPVDQAPALQIIGLTKAYPVGHLRPVLRPALHDLTLTAFRGEVFGYLGPNGSGKTTTIKLLLGLVRADSGRASVLDRPLGDPAWKYQAGYLPEHPYFYDYLTAAEYLDYCGRLFGLPSSLRRERARTLLRQVGLDRSGDVPLGRFSKGMSQRIGLAQALINDPEIVFLDEPMSGLDPLGRRLVRDLVLGLKERGKTVFLSTHILPDAEALCDRVGVLRAGHLVSVGRLDEILRIDIAHMEVLASGGQLDEQRPSGVKACSRLGERWRLEVTEEGLVEAIEWCRDGGARILSVQPVRQTLEDYFLKELGQAPGDTRWDIQD